MSTATVLAILFVFLVNFVALPLAGIWALNTLFGMGLDYSFVNWLAVVILSSIVQSVQSPVKSSKE